MGINETFHNQKKKKEQGESWLYLIDLKFNTWLWWFMSQKLIMITKRFFITTDSPESWNIMIHYEEYAYSNGF